MMSIGIIEAFVAAVLWVAAETAIKKLDLAEGYAHTAIIVTSTGILPILALGLTFGGFQFASGMLLLAALAGIFNGLGYVLNYASLETEQVTNTMALGNTVPALLVIYGLFVLKEPINPISAVLVAAIFCGAFLITLNKKFKLDYRLLPAFFSYVSWGVYWSILVTAIIQYHTLVVPLLVSRLIAIFIALFAQGVGLTSIRKRKRLGQSVLTEIFTIGIIAGVMDGLGDFSFAAVSLVNLVAIGSAIVATEPLLAAIAGRKFYMEKLTRLQLLGLVIIVFGAMMLGVFSGA